MEFADFNTCLYADLELPGLARLWALQMRQELLALQGLWAKRLPATRPATP